MAGSRASQTRTRKSASDSGVLTLYAAGGRGKAERNNIILFPPPPLRVEEWHKRSEWFLGVGEEVGIPVGTEEGEGKRCQVCGGRKAAAKKREAFTPSLP